MSTFAESLTDSPVLVDAAAGVYVVVKKPGVSDFLALAQSVAYSLVPSPLNQAIADLVAVAAAADPGPLRPRGEVTAVTDRVTLALSRAKAVTDAPVIDEFVVSLLLPGGVPHYNVVEAATATYVAGLSPPGRITLSHDGTTVTLRLPDFGDADRYEAYRIQRESRGGDLQIFQDPIWPTTEILDFKFSQLDDVDALLDFLVATQGAEIDLTDQYGRRWKGFVLTPEGQVTQPKRSTYAAAFRFQGVLQ